MPKLIITRGLPGCGKTHEARLWVELNPRGRARVNRDDEGAQLHGRRFYEDRDLMQHTEKAITAATHAKVTALLGRGLDVICDDTNLVRRNARDLRRLAMLHGADFEIWDMLDVPLDTVFAQNEQRKGTLAYVERDVYDRMIKRHTGRNAYEVPLAKEPDDDMDMARPYVPAPNTPKAVMVDIDGTVALMGTRSPFDETLVHQDRPNRGVIEAVRAMAHSGHLIVFCSGRTDACLAETLQWINREVDVPIEKLLMRKAGDDRKDSVVKLEIFDRDIRPFYDVTAVFDDRDQVVQAWRKIGLTVFQVAEGNF